MKRDSPPAGGLLRTGFLLACLVAPLVLQAATEPAPRATFGLDQEEAFAFSRATIGTIPRDHVLLDRQGREVSLSDYRGKPLLLNFVYTSCFQICPNSTRSLFAAVRAMRDRFGHEQFNVLSIGFNQPEDSPQAMAAFARQQRIDDRNWEFLSPRAEDVATLAADFGFRFAPTPAGFDHTLQVTVLDRDGRIYRQVLGDGFAADSLGEPIKQLVNGALIRDTASLADLLGRVRILCSVYDPITGTYRMDYTLYFEIAGGVTFLIAGLFFAVGEWRNRKRRQAATAGNA